MHKKSQAVYGSGEGKVAWTGRSHMGLTLGPSGNRCTMTYPGGQIFRRSRRSFGRFDACQKQTPAEFILNALATQDNGQLTNLRFAREAYTVKQAGHNGFCASHVSVFVPTREGNPSANLHTSTQTAQTNHAPFEPPATFVLSITVRNLGFRTDGQTDNRQEISTQLLAC